MRINIGKDFSDTPAGRFRSDGKHSGEAFRDDLLEKRLSEVAEDEKLYIKIDDVEGYGSSFLEEAFGGLVRKGKYSSIDLLNKLVFEFEDVDFEFYKKKIIEYIKDAK
ncbi:STAS-like domain-containing protein [Shewanella corallii]|uniref:STAS-like domain-containing protein n=1 Tax=Shewanella corallii TaxID=560080 RepID=A0ABT0N2Y5_9GAMM|nr:STAS-like domain-containing protein [Shewanella corallii]MCL2912807.1 STAS-like domain-containing protein [Shewanella corallii]